ncbi:MAG: B12-binding domain-containing radical SAM protein [Thermoanaerobaculia bacterium]
MRVTLSFPQVTHVMRTGAGDRTLPPNAVFYLAAILRRHGHEVRAEVLPRADLLAPSYVGPLVEGCDVLGLSANSINWRFARRLAIAAREARPDLPIVLGGIHPSLFPEHVLATTPADFVLRGEAETSLPELLDAIAAGTRYGGHGGYGGYGGFERIAGLTWRDGGEVRSNPARPLLTREELAAQPPPAFDLMPAGEYHGIGVESSRGCAFSCVFCSIPYRRSFRPLDAAAFCDRLARSLELAGPRLVSPFGKASVYILDDCFTTSKRRAVEIFDRLAPLRGRVRYGIEARADQVTEPLARTLAENELWLIQMGLESGYPEGLERVGKGLSIADIERACAILRDHGLSDAADYAFILGFPWEDRDDCLRTLDFALYLHLTYGGHISLAWYEPFPGSPLWERREEEGLRLSPGMFDDAGFDWRRSPEVFGSLRPRMTPADVAAVQQVAASIAALDPKYLRSGSITDDLDVPSLTHCA